MFGASWDGSQVERWSQGSLMTKEVLKVVFSPRPCVLVGGTGTMRRAHLLGGTCPGRGKTPKQNKRNNISLLAPQRSSLGK